MNNDWLISFSNIKINHHYETKYFQNYLKYTGSLPIENFEALKRDLKSQQSFVIGVNSVQKPVTGVTFPVTLENLKRGKLLLC